MSERSIIISPTLSHADLLQIPHWREIKVVGKVTDAIQGSMRELTGGRIEWSNVFREVEVASGDERFRGASGTIARDMAVRIGMIAQEVGWDLHDERIVFYAGLFGHERIKLLAEGSRDLLSRKRVFESKEKADQAEQRLREKLAIYDNDDQQSPGYLQIIRGAMEVFISENPVTSLPGIATFMQRLSAEKNISLKVNPRAQRYAMIDALRVDDYEDAVKHLEEMSRIRIDRRSR